MQKKYAFALIALAAILMTVSCQNKGAQSGKADEAIIAVADGNGALPGKFSVSDTKQIQFSKGNLYWDGSAFKFEDNQYDFPTSRNESHVGHFPWRSIAPGEHDRTRHDERTDTEVLFTNEAETTARPDFKVNGVQGKYRTLSAAEWTYLFKSRTNASNLYKCGVSVCGKFNCLILAPDDFLGTIDSSYDASNWPAAEAAGLVCLPAAGCYYEYSLISDVDSRGGYWSSYAGEGSDSYRGFFDGGNPRPEGIGHFVFFNSGFVIPDGINNRKYLSSIRLILESQIEFTN